MALPPSRFGHPFGLYAPSLSAERQGRGHAPFMRSKGRSLARRLIVAPVGLGEATWRPMATWGAFLSFKSPAGP